MLFHKVICMGEGRKDAWKEKGRKEAQEGRERWKYKENKEKVGN